LVKASEKQLPSTWHEPDLYRKTGRWMGQTAEIGQEKLPAIPVNPTDQAAK